MLDVIHRERIYSPEATDMEREEAIAAALAFIQKRKIRANEQTPVIAVFEKADQGRQYDRWVLLFETHPGMHPSDTAVVIQCPENIPRIVPLM
jgi:hypothetical protein